LFNHLVSDANDKKRAKAAVVFYCHHLTHWFMDGLDDTMYKAKGKASDHKNTKSVQK